MVACLDPSRPERVVELGPGTGAFTGAIHDRLGRDARFLAIDVDPTFVAAIRRRWPEVDCVRASAEQLAALVSERALGPIDHIVSGLPFVSLPASTTGAILHGIAAVLRPGGTFTTFQYLQGYALPPAVAFRRRLNALMGGAPESHFVLWNIPPAFVLTWRKGETGQT
jgi:phospholipid N-methyltransferase